jgi:prevent-host-death family protein
MPAETVTAREANQRFSELLRGVEAGRSYVVTKHGRPVARLLPAEGAGERRLTPEQEAALERLLATDWDLEGERFDREALHER